MIKVERQNQPHPICRGVDKAKKTWGYLDKLNSIAKRGMNALLHGCKDFRMNCSKLAGRVGPAVLHLKLFSIFTVFFNFFSIQAAGKSIHQAAQNSDPLSGFTSFLWLLLECGDSIDSGITFTQAFREKAGMAAIPILKQVGLPLGMTLASMGLLLRIIKIARFAHLLVKTNQVEDAETLRNYAAQPAERILGGGIRPKFDAFKVNPDMQEWARFSPTLKTHLQQKVALNVVGAVTNIFTILSLTFFLLSVAAYIPFLILAGVTVTRLGMLVFEEFGMQKLS